MRSVTVLYGLIALSLIFSGCLGIGYAKGEIVVTFIAGLSMDEINGTLEKYNLSIIDEREGGENTYYVKVPKGQEEKYVDILKDDPNVESATKSYYK